MVQVIVVLILAGVGLYLVNSLLPMDPKFKTLLNAVVVVAVVLWLLYAFGLFDMPGPRFRLR